MTDYSQIRMLAEAAGERQEPVGTPGCKQCKEAIECGFDTCPECDASLAQAETSSPAPVSVVPDLNDDLREILGRPNFRCYHIALALRSMGYEIARKSEDEQAVVIYWMLGHYLRDSKNWRENANREIRDGYREVAQ